MVIQHNLSAMNSNRQLGITTGLQAKSSEKLSSGYRINRAADDAASLAISEKMRRQIRGLSQGIDNVQDGISMNQIGDGALEEVMDMLQRMNELCIKAANETLTDSDRSYIQSEIDAISAEVDRVGEVTTFNDIKIFGNGEETIYNADGTPLIAGDIPYSSFSFADVNIDSASAFGPTSHGDYHSLRAVVNNTTSAANGTSYGLVYGDGSTTSSSVRFSYADGNKTVTKVASLRNDFTISNFTNNGGTVSRTFTYKGEGANFSIVETVTPNPTDKYYGFNYTVINNGDKIDLEFMFHSDTAYENKDYVESYYTNGNLMDTTRIYRQSDYDGAPSGSGVITGVPSSLSIINKDEALSFAENISFSNTPDMLSVGVYSAIKNWQYYNNTSALGNNTKGMDLGFSAVWQNKDMESGDQLSVSFKYGITPTESDSNINHSDVKMSEKAATRITEEKQFWIQASSEKDDGMYISFGPIDQDVLGIRYMDVQIADNARDSIGKVKGALAYVSAMRSKIGAQQNRLEHTCKNLGNVMENTQDAESQIRDTDMAAEMVKHSNESILAQAGQAMLAQANQTNQGVLSLLQ